jgi:hypothetical protein
VDKKMSNWYWQGFDEKYPDRAKERLKFMAKPLVKIDRRFLPKQGWQETGKQGLTAKFYPDGQLKELKSWQKGKCVRSLKLAHGKAEGREEIFADDEGGYELYRDGTYENFDAWSDNSSPQPCDFQQWVKKWIKFYFS